MVEESSPLDGVLPSRRLWILRMTRFAVDGVCLD